MRTAVAAFCSAQHCLCDGGTAIGPAAGEARQALEYQWKVYSTIVMRKTAVAGKFGAIR
jgi:hypothetical protein